MKNYYQILQVDEKASVEIIEKAYKVLVKRYHPDLQKNEKNKSISEQKLKEINEAYDVLSDEFLREQYDFEFKREKNWFLFYRFFLYFCNRYGILKKISRRGGRGITHHVFSCLSIRY